MTNNPDADRMGFQEPINPTQPEHFNPDHPVIDPRKIGLWIPVELLEAEDISRVERDLASLVYSLMQNDMKACYASNRFLGERLRTSERNIANTLVGLKKKGYVKQTYWDGRRRHLITILPIHQNGE